MVASVPRVPGYPNDKKLHHFKHASLSYKKVNYNKKFYFTGPVTNY
jgi:hypothetical protein